MEFAKILPVLLRSCAAQLLARDPLLSIAARGFKALSNKLPSALVTDQGMALASAIGSG